MPRVSILTTGNEIITGRTTDTNSSRICSVLTAAGFDVQTVLQTGDEIENIERALRYLSPGNDIVITTGGLGPTDDDNTITALRRVYGFKIITHEPSLEKMKDFFSVSGRTFNEIDMKMVSVPENSIVIENKKGLAPGFIIESGRTVTASLPGVPVEMEPMLKNSLLPFLSGKFNTQPGTSFSLTIAGMRESEINEKVNKILGGNKTGWGITAAKGIVSVTFYGSDENIFDRQKIMYEAEDIFGEYLISPPFARPEEELLHLLVKKGLRIATAESCTGGLISKRLTDIPGSSRVYTGSVIAYTNELKHDILGVSADTLREYGAVSKETAAEMAEGARKRLGADIGISTTGIAGPGGGTESKPVGTVCFGFSTRENLISITRRMRGDRDMIRTFSSLFAIDYLRRMIKKN